MAAIVAQAGCEGDTRISVKEFLENHQEALVVSTSQPATQPASQPELKPWSPGPYAVGPGDVLGITVSGLDKLGLPGSYTLRVTQKGEVVLPSVGPVKVSGLTLDEAELAIQAHYSPKYMKETQVTVQVVEYKPINVMVLGDVLRPGEGVELRRNRTSVLQAMLAAGGPAEFGGLVTLIPARDPERSSTFDLSKRADLVRAARPGTVEDADVLIVDRRPSDTVYIEGLVNKPGPVPLPRGATLSVLQALGSAGGTLLAFEPKEATLMRREPDGELIRVKLELDQIKLGNAPDIALAAGDVLLVPHTAATRFEEFIAKSFSLRIGTGVETTYNPWTEYYLKKEAQYNGYQNGFFSTLTSQLTNQLSTLGVVQPPVAQP